MSFPPPQSATDPFAGMTVQSAYLPGVSFQFQRRLGEGGTAMAYLALRCSPEGESPVVVKVILPRLVAESDAKANTIVKKEAVALGRLNERVPPTPFVVRLVDTGALHIERLGRQLELPWIALEYVHGGVEGTTLEERVAYSVYETGFAFDPERTARAVLALAQGLTEIHAVGVVHRDLHPGNVLCCGAGESELFKISDFGIARPAGLAATFGNVLVGTPGYVALEQIMSSSVPVGTHTDIFSMAGIVFFLLTGEHYFDVNSPGEAVSAIKSPVRRTLLEVPTLSYELREREAACQAIDLALARATSADPQQRPQSARQFADSLVPWISPMPTTTRPSRRWVSAMQKVRAIDVSAASNWTVRHPPGDERLVLSVGWNAAGDSIAATTRGLAFWNGTRWADAPTAGLPVPQGIRFVKRLAPASWLIGSDYARLAEYSRDGARELFRGPDESVSFLDATVDFDDIAVVVGQGRTGPPLLYAFIGKRWLKPLPVLQAATINSIARVDDETWLAVGRSVDGTAFAARYWPLRWELERINLPPGRALLACAGRPERTLATAVGSDGVVLRLDGGASHATAIPERPDLAAIAIDTLGVEWAAGRGHIWVRRTRGDWECVWQHTAWQPPFISLMAEVGAVVAMTVDGAVLECRASTLDKTKPAL